MLQYARQQFDLQKQVSEGGTTKLAHLEQAARQLGTTVAALLGADYRELPPFPLVHVLRWFYEAASGRTVGFNGPARLSFQDILAWSTLMAVQVEPWEVELIMQLDALWLEVVVNGSRGTQPGGAQ